MMQFDEEFYSTFHMNTTIFEELFERIEKHLLPKRKSLPIDQIPPRHRLVLTLE